MGGKFVLKYAKNILRNVIKKINYTCFSNEDILVDQRIDSPAETYFCGYYDVEVLRNNKIIFHGVDLRQNFLTTPNKAKIYLRNLTSGTKCLASTTAVNWQLGARLQWIDDSRIYYLDHVDQRLTGKVLDLSTGIVKHEFPWWLRDEKNRIGITMDFSKIYEFRPGYGYYDTTAVKSQGIDVVRLYENKVIFSLSEHDLCKTLEIKEKGYFNHAVVSETGELVLTTYNIETKDARICYPILIDLVLGDFKVLKLPGIFSHPTFTGEGILYFNGEGYVHYNLQKGKASYLLHTRSDGHPTLRDNIVYTDTYPDRLSRMKLYRFDEQKKIKILSEFLVSPRYHGNHRCDLHPRINQGFIIYDRPLSNRRCIELIRV